jgi:peroxiredoxin
MKRLSTLVTALLLASTISVAQSKAPDFTLTTAGNTTMEMKNLLGKVVVVNFWATWCRPCIAEMPGFSEIYDRLHEKGLEIIGVSLDEGGWGKVKPFLAKNSVSYPIVVGNDDLYLAYGGDNGIPTTVFVDRKGNIVDRHVGAMSKEEFEAKVRKLL